MNGFYLLFLLVIGVRTQVSLYISHAEMNRTLGLHAELGYIENGVVNAYSTKFPYRVDSHIDHVTFTWHASGKYYYSAHVDSEDMSVLPVLRIPTNGEVPHQAQEFSVEYRCAGHRSGQFMVSLFFNFTSPHAPKSTIVRLKQEKICASRDGRRGLSGIGAEELDHQQGGNGDGVQETFYIIIGAAAVFLIIIAVLLISFFRRSKKESAICTPTPPRMASRPASGASRPSFKQSLRSSAQPFLTSTPIRQPPPSTANSLLETSSMPSTSAASEPDSIFPDRTRNVDVPKALVALHTDREPFNMVLLENQGTFGEVRFAIWRQTDDMTNGDVDDDEDAPCHEEAMLCKTLKKHATPAQLEKFLQEALAFHSLPPHANLAQVVCAASFGKFDDPATVKDFPLICYRHQGFGNLRKFLQNCREGDKKGALRTQEYVSLCLQLSRAFSHLHKHKVLHKDLAARNCIISEIGSRLHVQLCDAALSKDLYPGDYHCLGDNDNRPIKWMSPEAIAQRQMTSAGDVWSFGVLCWEIFSLGAAPYTEIDAEDMQDALLRGVRLSQPFNCPDQMFNVMFCCWRERPKERPSADHVNGALEQFSMQLTQFV